MDDSEQVVGQLLLVIPGAVLVVNNDDLSTGFSDELFNELVPESAQPVSVGNNNLSDSSL
jgi:hypothetical protein